MKPVDFKPPFPRRQPQLTYAEQFLALPDRIPPHPILPSWQQVFGNEHPVEIEYCSGNGHWIVGQAQQHPQINYVAVEWDFARARKIVAKRTNHGVNNLLIVCGEARLFTETQVQARSVARVWIHFPDPWPKRRHAKHRLMQAPFMQALTRVLVPEGQLVFVSDDPVYTESTYQLMREHRVEVTRCMTHEYGTSTFAQLWQREGKSFFHLSGKQAL